MCTLTVKKSLIKLLLTSSVFTLQKTDDEAIILGGIVMAKYEYTRYIEDYEEPIVISNADVDRDIDVTIETILNPGMNVTILEMGIQAKKRMENLFSIIPGTEPQVINELHGKLTELFCGRLPGWKMTGACLSLMCPSFHFVKPLPDKNVRGEKPSYDEVSVTYCGFDYMKVEFEVDYGDSLPSRRYIVEMEAKKSLSHDNLDYIIVEYFGKRKIRRLKISESERDVAGGRCLCHITEY